MEVTIIGAGKRSEVRIFERSDPMYAVPSITLSGVA